MLSVTMAANATFQNQPAIPPDHQQASGFSIFWALLAIIFNCMLQSSPTGYLWNGDVFEGSLWPHRSSPLVCWIDTVADVWMAVQRFRNGNPSPPDQDSHAIKPGILTKLALFCLGVVPQAVSSPALVLSRTTLTCYQQQIKLFSMRGISWTQTIAAVFFLSSTVNLLRTLCIRSPQADISSLVGTLESSAWQLCRNARVVTCIIAGTFHIVGMFALWYTLADSIGLDAPKHVANPVNWIVQVSLLVSNFYLIQHVFFIVIDMKTPVSLSCIEQLQLAAIAFS